jgi:hypothetical protein
MIMTEMPQRLVMEIGAGPDADVEELVLLRDGLRDELLGLDVEVVDLIGSDSAPRGAKGKDREAVGALVIALYDSAVVVALVGVLRAWAGRSAGRRVKVHIGEDSIEISQVSAEQRAILIETWLGRHARR